MRIIAWYDDEARKTGYKWTGHKINSVEGLLFFCKLGEPVVEIKRCNLEEARSVAELELPTTSFEVDESN